MGNPAFTPGPKPPGLSARQTEKIAGPRAPKGEHRGGETKPSGGGDIDDEPILSERAVSEMADRNIGPLRKGPSVGDRGVSPYHRPCERSALSGRCKRVRDLDVDFDRGSQPYPRQRGTADSESHHEEQHESTVSGRNVSPSLENPAHALCEPRLAGADDG